MHIKHNEYDFGIRGISHTKIEVNKGTHILESYTGQKFEYAPTLSSSSVLTSASAMTMPLATLSPSSSTTVTRFMISLSVRCFRVLLFIPFSSFARVTSKLTWLCYLARQNINNIILSTLISLWHDSVITITIIKDTLTLVDYLALLFEHQGWGRYIEKVS